MERTLFVRIGALGDVLLLRKAIAGCRLQELPPVLLAPARVASVLLDPGGSGVEAVLDAEGPDGASLFAGEPSPHVRETLSKCSRARVYSRDPDLLSSLTKLIPIVESRNPYPGSGSAADYYAEGFESPVPPSLSMTAEEEEVLRPLVAELPRGFLAVHPGSGSQTKNWGGFLDLVKALCPRDSFLLVQGPADIEACRPLLRLPGVRAHSLSLRLLGGLLAKAGLFVGNDSGVTHLAAAFGTPVLALFGPTDPAIWSPVGPVVRTLRAKDGEMSCLSLAEVEAEARSLLGAGRPDVHAAHEVEDTHGHRSSPEAHRLK